MTDLIAADVSQAAEVSYHKDYARISRSMLSVLKQSPRLFYELYVARTRQPAPPTEAMARGTRFDVLLLDPVGFAKRYVVAPLFGPDGTCWDRRRTHHKNAWAQFAVDAAGREIITVEEHNELLQMVAGAMRHEEIRQAVETQGLVQHRLDWDDPVFGTPCRCLMDKVFVSANLVVDIKTAEDPSPEAFRRSVARFNYAIQDAFYSRGFRCVYGTTPRFLFGVVGSKPPYDAAVYELDDEAKEAGVREADLLLSKYESHKRNDDWCASWCKGVVTLGLPRWANNPFSNEVYE